MKLILLLGFIVPVCWGTACNVLKTCTECDSLLSSKGKQLCSWCATTGGCVPKSALECRFGTGVKIPEVSDCPIDIQKGYEFDEELSRKMMVISGAAYSDNPEVCLAENATDVQISKQIILACDNMGDFCSAYSAISHAKKAIILAFRGTIGFVQILMEAEYAMFQTKIKVSGGGNVCAYFNDAFFKLWDNGMKAEFEKLKKLYPDYELWVTGHSMGAAIATVGAHVIGAEKLFDTNRMKVITFGEPRVGDRDFMIAHDKLFPYNYRVTHGRDIVTHVPPKDMLDYHHHRYEVWYPEEMAEGDKYIICLSPEDKSCSDQNWVQMSAMDHRYYYGIDVQGIIDNGCVATV